MSSDKQIKFLEEQQVKQPRQAARYHTFADLYQRRLWHQLTLALQEAIADPDFTRQQHLIPLYEKFISSFAHRLNLLSLAKIGTTVARQFSKPSESVSFVERLIDQIKEAKLPRTEQPLLYLHMEIGYHKLQDGQLIDAKNCVESGREQLEAMQDVSDFLHHSNLSCPCRCQLNAWQGEAPYPPFSSPILSTSPFTAHGCFLGNTYATEGLLIACASTNPCMARRFRIAVALRMI